MCSIFLDNQGCRNYLSAGITPFYSMLKGLGLALKASDLYYITAENAQQTQEILDWTSTKPVHSRLTISNWTHGQPAAAGSAAGVGKGPMKLQTCLYSADNGDASVWVNGATQATVDLCRLGRRSTNLHCFLAVNEAAANG